MDKVLAYLYKYSDLQVTFGVNMVAIADGKPRADWACSRMIRYYIRPSEERRHRAAPSTSWHKAKARAHILEGLMIAVDNLDEVIAADPHQRKPQGGQGGPDGSASA